MPAGAELVCPKCGGRMLPYERSGVVVEQCQECRGVFLDLGELERLIDAEGGGWSGRVEPPAHLVDSAAVVANGTGGPAGGPGGK